MVLIFQINAHCFSYVHRASGDMAAGPPNPRELAMVVASAVAGALSQQQAPVPSSSPNMQAPTYKASLYENYLVEFRRYVVELKVSVQPC